jgi:hypothetical protein
MEVDMAIDFTLTQDQKALQRKAREFARDLLQPLVAKADAEPDTQKAFEMMKAPYKEAYRLGFAMGFLPKKYGGGDVSNIDLQIAAEEICAVDPGFATILLVNGLALMPVAWFGTEKQKTKWIGEATSDPTGEYLAGWTVSEPGGTANFDHPDAHPVQGEFVNFSASRPCRAVLPRLADVITFDSCAICFSCRSTCSSPSRNFSARVAPAPSWRNPCCSSISS